MLETLSYLTVIIILVGFPAWYITKDIKHKRSAKTKLEKALERGIEPVSLHPKIDPTRCIGTAACVAACPEGDILGLVHGKAALVAPNRCIGHGGCEAACPVEAITLVFGTERRGVDIPYVKKNFESNVPGIYIAGELGGMGLIRNAVTQGREAAEYIRENLKSSYPDVFDIAIVGAGPAGLAASLQAQKDNLSYIALEQDDIGGTILTYPRRKLVMTQPMDIPLYGKLNFREIIKEDLTGLWSEIIEQTQLEIKTKEKVETIEKEDDHYRIVSSKGEYRAQRVVLSIGRRGTPRKLGVPGEKTSKVAYRLLEPEQYASQQILVVGGGDSAIEAALSLSEQKKTHVTLSYRKNVFSRLKEKNDERIERAIEEGRVNVFMESNVMEIRRKDVILSQHSEEISFANDQVFIFIGGELPTQFLRKIGIKIEKKFGQR